MDTEWVRTECSQVVCADDRSETTGADVALTPDVSVVVPTLNRAGRLTSLLAALCEQQVDGVRFEIIVVDNGSTDWTRAAVERFRARDRRLQYIREPRRGASRARNAGIAAATAPIVAFLDDDVLPARDWVRALKRTFDANPAIDCVGGQIEPLWPSELPRWLTPRHYAPLALQMNRTREFDADHASACLVTANFACRRSVFDDVGGFAPDFLRDEDREFNLRLWRAGKRGLFTSEVRAAAIVDPDRLNKTYHRRWYETTGTNHARLKFREIIDAQGRLVLPAAGRRFRGVPGYIYRECLEEILRWVSHAVRGRWSDAFYHECRVRYLCSYIATRAHILVKESA